MVAVRSGYCRTDIDSWVMWYDVMKSITGIYWEVYTHDICRLRLFWLLFILKTHFDIIPLVDSAKNWKVAWWRHQLETFSALLAICAGNSSITDEFPTQRPVTRSFGVFFDLRLNKRLSKQWWGWWFEVPSRSVWRHFKVLKAHLNIIPSWQCRKLERWKIVHNTHDDKNEAVWIINFLWCNFPVTGQYTAVVEVDCYWIRTTQHCAWQ